MSLVLSKIEIKSINGKANAKKLTICIGNAWACVIRMTLNIPYGFSPLQNFHIF